MNLSVNCWITGQSPSALAEEISTYEANIQKDVYENHLKQGNRDDWNGYTLNLFKKHSEKYYTTDLEQYKFDKTECKACAHNAANYNLFAEHNGLSHIHNSEPTRQAESSYAVFCSKKKITQPMTPIK